jgi:tetratricopeptide (TPR) repeat protein
MVIGNNTFAQQGLAALPQVVSHSLYFGAVPLNGGLYRPLAGAYYLVIGALGGLHHAPVYHFFQLLLYGLNAAVVFWFFGRLRPLAFVLQVLATLLFIVHPIHTEVVCNIKSADEMLCLLFFLASAGAWLTYADTAVSWWGYVSVAAYALAVCSKETAVPMLVALPALWYFFRRRPIGPSLIAAWPFAVVALAYLAVRQAVLAAEPPTPIVTVLNNALLSTNDRTVQLASAITYLGRYALMLVWPWPLSFDYSYGALPLNSLGDWQVWLAAALCLGLLALGVLGFRGRRLGSFAVLWCGASIVLVSNVFFFVSTNFGERLLYLPSVMACYGAAAALLRLGGLAEDRTFARLARSPFVVGPVVAIVFAAALAVTRRAQEWRDQLTLFSADVQTYPHSARLNDFAGNLNYFAGERIFERDGMVADASSALTNATIYLTRAVAIRGTFLDLDAPLGLAEYRLGDYTAAIPHLEQALAFTTYRSQALETMAEAYTALHDADQATKLFKQIDAEGLQYPPAWFALGNEAASRGDDVASIRYFQRFLDARPDNMAAYFNLGKAENRQGDYVQSLAAAERCIALKPAPRVEADCLVLSADDLARTGHREEALQRFERARAIDPTNPLIKR